MLWFKPRPWFEQNQCFCVQTIIYTKSCFTQKLCYPQTPAQGLFAAYRIALSMVAGGTHRRRLNNMPDDLNDMNDNININKGII